ncbi:MAG TPA: hypothetical protein DD651_07250, partial [Trichococcus sp.]|nr:hypothetical protein [Trichococcus sp.]
KMPMTVTIKDVAREAGVATSTVSRTLKDSPLISENTKVKVRQAMQKLGYTPNFAAQNLANKSTQTIGVILPVANDGESCAESALPGDDPGNRRRLQRTEIHDFPGDR